MAYINRHAEKTLKRLVNEFPALLVTGARQTGKTTLLKRFTELNEIPDMTFDDPSEELSAREDPRTFLSLHPAPYMFDEIQYVPELFRYIKMTVDADRKPGMFFLTGSQPFNLMQQASESLAGRLGVLHLYPLSQREIDKTSFDAPFVPDTDYLEKRKSSVSKDKTDVWDRIFRGGYPEVVNGHVQPGDFYENYLKTYIERDIRRLSQVADELQFLQFIRATAARTGNLVNYSDLAHDVGISEVTAKKWLSLMVTSGLVYLLPPYSANVEKRVIKTPKLYFVDTGLAAHLTHWSSPEVLRDGAMAGNIYETWVVGEILKSYANAGVDAPMYFYRDKDKMEIDLILCRDRTIYPIEIKKTASPGSEDVKNFGVVRRISGVTAAQPVVLCNCPSPVSLGRGALAIPAGYI